MLNDSGDYYSRFQLTPSDVLHYNLVIYPSFLPSYINGGLMSGGLKSGGLMSGGLLSGGLKSANRGK